MKKILIIIAIGFFCFNANSQKWINRAYYSEMEISGIFSNYATTDSKLRVVLQKKVKNIEIYLYEYNGTNPVKSYSYKYYKLSITDDLGKNHKFFGCMYSNSIILNKSNTKKLNKLMESNRSLYVFIYEAKYFINNYSFYIRNEK